MSADPRADPLDLIDRTALAKFLAEAAPPDAAAPGPADLLDPAAIRLLAGGASNLTYLVRSGGHDYVLRRRPLGPTPARAHDMHREFRVLSALAGRGLPVPRVHAYHEADDVVGAPCYLMDFIEGTVIHELSDARRLTAEQAAGCCDALVDTLARLHAIDPAELDIPNPGRPGNFVERRIRSWLRQWEGVEHRDLPDLERLGAVLLRDVPPQPGTTLVHGDYRLGNLMFRVSPDVAMTAILDWELSTIGDPLTDLAHLLVYWEPTRGRVTHPAQLIPRAPGFASGPELAARYAAATGTGLSHLRFYLAFEHWRAAIIKDAIYLRRCRALPPGAEPDADLAQFGRYVQLHLDEAAELLESSAPTSYPSEE